MRRCDNLTCNPGFGMRLLLPFCFGLFLTVPVVSQAPSFGLAAYYSFSGNANDESGNGNNGTVVNASLTTDSLGNSNSAYYFNGTSAYINVANSSSLQIADSVSIIFWAKRNRLSIDPIIEKGGDWFGNDPNFGIGLHSANNNMFYFWYDGGWRGANGVSDNGWHLYMVVAKHGDANPTLYIDGSSLSVIYSGGSGTISLNSASAADMHIGAQVDGGNTLYGENSVDEVRVYHRLLTPEEVNNYPLPVQMTGLIAKIGNGEVQLQWSTATEVDNSGWQIERRNVGTVEEWNGATNSNIPIFHNSIYSSSWTAVGFVEGAGTSTSPRSYSYSDAIPQSTFSNPHSRYAYRLQQLDRSGAFSYSGEVEVEFGTAPKMFALSQNYPNPFNPTTTIEFSLPEDGRATLKILNVLGQEVATVFDGQVNAGRFQRVNFDASDVASGLYFSRLESGGKQLLRKMILMK